MKTAILDTVLGKMELKGDENGLSAVVFTEKEASETSEIPADLQNAALQLQQYFKGNRTDFNLKLNLQGTPFQQKVWQQLATIPFGKTCSYLQIAQKLGDPKVIRAAAFANGRNPVCIIIPCHRVVGSDQSLTGYAGGIWRKKWLLEHENPVKQTSLFD